MLEAYLVKPAWSTDSLVPDVIKTIKYRPDFWGRPMSEVFQEVMRGPSEWSVGDRELMAAFVSKTNECEF